MGELEAFLERLLLLWCPFHRTPLLLYGITKVALSRDLVSLTLRVLTFPLQVLFHASRPVILVSDPMIATEDSGVIDKLKWLRLDQILLEPKMLSSVSTHFDGVVGENENTEHSKTCPGLS